MIIIIHVKSTLYDQLVLMNKSKVLLQSVNVMWKMDFHQNLGSSLKIFSLPNQTFYFIRIPETHLFGLLFLCFGRRSYSLF